MVIFQLFGKKSFVIPDFKSGDKHNVSNYRIINKMSLILKIFEAILTKKLTVLCHPILYIETRIQTNDVNFNKFISLSIYNS